LLETITQALEKLQYATGRRVFPLDEILQVAGPTLQEAIASKDAAVRRAAGEIKAGLENKRVTFQ
jgi:hypothetical protein